MAVRRPAPKTTAPAAAVATKTPKAAPAVEPAPVAEPAAPVAVAEVAPAPTPETVSAPKAELPNVDFAALQDNFRAAAVKTIEQGKIAYDRMKVAGDEAVQSIEASLSASSKGAVEFAAKTLETVKANADATFDHLKALAGAKNVADAVSLHGEFVRKQSEAAIAQAKELADLAKKTATEAGATIQAHFKKSA